MPYMDFRHNIWYIWNKCYYRKIPKNDEYFKLIVDTNTLGFRMWAMRNIDLVEVKRPLHLRKEMQEIIKKLLINIIFKNFTFKLCT